jgi:hypothetical protein
MLGNEAFAASAFSQSAAQQDAQVFVTTIDAEGWGRGIWSSGAWGVQLLTNMQATTAVGNAEARPTTKANVDGVEATGEVTGVDVFPGTGVDIFVTGVEGRGIISFRGVKVWGRIIPDADNTWVNVAGTTNTWIDIAPNATNEYTEIRP